MAVVATTMGNEVTVRSQQQDLGLTSVTSQIEEEEKKNEKETK